MTMFETVIWGIISGICSTILCFGIIKVINNIIVPWYRYIVYRGINVEGEWSTEATPKSGNKENLVLNIEQKANILNGRLTVLKKNNEIKTYELKGFINDRFIQLTGKNRNKKMIGFNVALLEVISGGIELHGYETIYNTITSKVESYEMEWKRT